MAQELLLTLMALLAVATRRLGLAQTAGGLSPLAYSGSSGLVLRHLVTSILLSIYLIDIVTITYITNNTSQKLFNFAWKSHSDGITIVQFGQFMCVAIIIELQLLLLNLDILWYISNHIWY